MALVPYWYFGSAVGEQLLSKHLQARLVVAMHVPPGEVETVRAQLAESDPEAWVFQESMQSRSLERTGATAPK